MHQSDSMSNVDEVAKVVAVVAEVDDGQRVQPNLMDKLKASLDRL
jgi:hypothetical protein